MKIEDRTLDNRVEEDISKKLIDNNNFKRISQLNKKVLDMQGLYAIRLKEGSKLPSKYQTILESRGSMIIYIGKAEKTIGQRLEQELEHKSPGTFFRSVGCVLGYLPIKGHLIGRVNQNNFKFSKNDTEEIINWLEKNTEVSIVAFEGKFDLIEGKLIEKHTPLLNINKNPLRLRELIDDRKRCKDIARGIKNIRLTGNLYD